MSSILATKANVSSKFIPSTCDYPLHTNLAYWKYALLWLSLMSNLLFQIVVGTESLWCRDIFLCWCCNCFVGCSRSVWVWKVLLTLFDIVIFVGYVFGIMDMLVWWSKNIFVFFGCCGVVHSWLRYSMLDLSLHLNMICGR